MSRCLACFHDKGAAEFCPVCGSSVITKPMIANQLAPGTLLRERYIIGLALNSGGFGIVYRAWDDTLKRTVAIKEFYPNELCNRIPGHMELEIHNPELYYAQLRRFRLEAQSLARFSEHPNIVKVTDCFDETNTSYIVMEYIDGETLKNRLHQRSSPMRFSETMCIMTPVFDAVKAIHAAGILHRDLSPDNIMISMDNRIKVIDFGAAKLSDDDNYDVVKQGFAPPEQYADSKKQGIFTDIYTLGAAMYEMLTGVKMEEALDRSMDERSARKKKSLLQILLSLLIKQEPEAPLLDLPSDLGSDCPENAERAIMRALAIDPDLRFKNITAFEDALNGKVIRSPEDEERHRGRIRLLVGTGLAVMSLLIVTLSVRYISLNRVPAISDYVTKSTSINVWVIQDEAEPDRQAEAWNAIENDFAVWLAEQKGMERREIKLNLYFHPVDTYRELLLHAREDAPDLYQTPDYGGDFGTIAADLDFTWQLTGKKVNFLFDRMSSDFGGNKYAPLSFDIGAVYYRQQGNGLEAQENNYTLIQLTEKVSEVGIRPGCYALLAQANGVPLSESSKALPLLQPLLNEYAIVADSDKMPLDLFLEGTLDTYIGGLSEYMEIRERLLLGFSVEAMPGTEEKLFGRYTNVFCVNKNRLENERYAAMTLLAFLYDTRAQDTLFLQGDRRRDLPLNPDVLDAYARALKSCDFFTVDALKEPQCIEMLAEHNRPSLAVDARLSAYIHGDDLYMPEEAFAAIES